MHSDQQVHIYQVTFQGREEEGTNSNQSDAQNTKPLLVLLQLHFTNFTNKLSLTVYKINL